MDTFAAIRAQRAVRAYADQPVSDEQLRQVLDAGRRSGSSKNSQPWQFVIVRDERTRNALADCGRFAEHLRQAPIAIVVVMPGATFWYGVDAGRTAQNMMLAAASLGLGTCIATMHDPDCARRVLRLPDDLHPHLTFSLGVPEAPAPTGDERAFQRTVLPRRGRKPLDELLHYEQWGQRDP